MSDNDIVILSAVRTAQGRFMGGFAKTPAIDLGAIVMKEALVRAGVAGEQLEEVIFGNVIQAGLGQNTARQAEIKAGIPVDVPAITVNRVCVSSASAMAMAANAIKAGDGDIYLVGGMENMTRAPWVLQDGRTGYRMGMPTGNMYDTMVWDGLWDAFNNYHMGMTAENLSEKFGITREQQDEVAYKSHVNAVAAIDAGRFKDEIVPVVIPQRKGDPVVIDTDECPRRDASLESMAKLKPFFKEGGVVTAGNASALSDGASAVVLTSRKKAGLAAKDVDLAEFNEAFACVAALATRELGLAADIVNVNGGAVALGHPLGNTGTRMVVTLIHELQKRGKTIGLTGACVGGGQGAGSVIKVEG